MPILRLETTLFLLMSSIVSEGPRVRRSFHRLGVAGGFLGMLLLGACSSEPDETKSAKPTKGAAAATLVAPVAAPLNVSVFLEYSGGMKGFVPRGGADKPATEFQQRIGALITETQVSAAVASRKYFLCENAAPRAVQFAQLRNLVQGNVTQAALGTELPQMLEGILARPQAAQEVSVIISDFIYGPEDRSAFSQLPNLIRTSIALVSQRQLAVAVFGETSRFYGSYFPAVKTPVPKRTLNGEKVPYYVWVIGPPALVARYAAEVFRNAPAQQAFFGLKMTTPSFAPVMLKLTDPKLKPIGSVFGEDNGLTLNVSDDPAEFTVGVNLKELPAAWQQPAFLAQHLQVRLPNGQASLLPNTVRLLTEEEQSGQPVLAPYTHVLRLRVNKLAASTATLSLALPAPETPGWVAAWSTTNDNTPTPRTFGLDQILTGVRQSYPAPLPPVFTVQLPLKNDK